MQYGRLSGVLALTGAMVLSTLALAQSPPTSESKNAPVGPLPGLTGIWQRVNERGDNYSFTKDPIPMQPWAQEIYDYNKGPGPEGYGRAELDPVRNCYPPGLSRMYYIPYPIEIIQLPGRVLMLFEWDHWVRQIWTDGRGHNKGYGPTWMGDSIGHWDGETLVTDTVNLNSKTWLTEAGHVHSDALHITERMKRLNHDTLEIRLTFDDPKAYTRPWEGTKRFELMPGISVMEDVVCEDKLLRE